MKRRPPSTGRPLLSLFAAAFTLMTAGLALPALLSGGTTSPVSVTLLSPASGSIVSNTIALSAAATSSAAPIARVEFYVDDKLVGVVGSNNAPVVIAPSGLRVSP